MIILATVLALFAQYVPSGSRAPAGPATIANVRGTSQFNSGGSGVTTAVIPIPTGTVAGDFAVIYCSGGWGITAVSGWTTIALPTPNIWNLYAASKVLTSGDISTGSVSVVQSGSFDFAGAMTTFIGATSGVREFEISTFGTSPATLTTTSGVLSTDVGIYWATTRGNFSLSITPGAGAVDSLYTQTIFTSNASTHSLMQVQGMPGGTQANLFSSVGSLVYAMQIIVAQ